MNEDSWSACRRTSTLKMLNYLSSSVWMTSRASLVFIPTRRVSPEMRSTVVKIDVCPQTRDKALHQRYSYRSFCWEHFAMRRFISHIFDYKRFSRKAAYIRETNAWASAPSWLCERLNVSSQYPKIFTGPNSTSFDVIIEVVLQTVQSENLFHGRPGLLKDSTSVHWEAA